MKTIILKIAIFVYLVCDKHSDACLMYINGRLGGFSVIWLFLGSWFPC